MSVHRRTRVFPSFQQQQRNREFNQQPKTLAQFILYADGVYFDSWGFQQDGETTHTSA